MRHLLSSRVTTAAAGSFVPRAAVSRGTRPVLSAFLAIALGMTAVAQEPPARPERSDPQGHPARPERPGVPDDEQRQVRRPPPQSAPVRTPQGARPPIRVEPTNIDLGFLPPKTIGVARFTLTNHSDGPLTILDLSPTCRCTTVGDHVGKVIEPNVPYVIDVNLDPATVPQSRSATVRVLIDGFSRTIDLAVRGEVSNPLRTLPGWINVPSGEVPSGRLVIESIDDTPFRICSVHGHPVRHTGFDPANDDPRSRYVIEYDIADFGDGPLPGWMIIETDHPTFPVVDVRLRTDAMDFNVGIRGIRDFRIPLGRIAPGDAKEATIEFANLSAPVTFVRAESLHEDATAELVGQEGDRSLLKVTVRVRPREDHRGLLYLPIRVHTDRGASQDVIVFATVNDGSCGASPSAPKSME